MENKAFSDKDARYYNIEKSRLLPLIPDGSNSVLDLGCANGRLGRNLRQLNKASELVGVEIFEPAAQEAAKYYDKIYQGDIEQLQLTYREHFDFVICADILEHLRDPMVVVDRIHGWLKNNGTLISCVPNVRYWRVIRDLILLGKWEYVEAGILDSTHLRFFTRNTFIEMLKKANFNITHQEMVIYGGKHNFVNRFTLGLFEEFMGYQVIVSAKKSGI